MSWKREVPNITDDHLKYRMGLFSLFRKNKQASAADGDEFHSRAEASPVVRTRSKRKSEADAADPMLPEKKRARRRLVGAVALVLAAIIGLPMVFDSEPKPLSNDIAIQIPSKDASASSNGTRQLPSPSVRQDATPPIPEQKPVTVPAQTAASSSAKTAASSPVSDNSNPGANEHAKNETPAVEAPKSNVSHSSASAEQIKPLRPAPVDEKAKVAAILDGKPNAGDNNTHSPNSGDPAAAKKAGKFVVQVAALASPEKVAALQNQLKEAGIKSYTQKVATESGDRIRIRIGPFAGKDEAEKMQAKLVKLGLNGKLVPS